MNGVKPQTYLSANQSSMEAKILILKHVVYEIEDADQLKDLEGHLRNTTAEIKGVSYQDIFFVKGEKEFVLFLDCESQEEYLNWRQICPPPAGARDWYEVLLSRDEYLSVPSKPSV